MKTDKRLTRASQRPAYWAVVSTAVLCGSLIAQAPPTAGPLDPPPAEREPSLGQRLDVDPQERLAIITQPKKVNKATSLIGMEVRGSDGKGVGKIHDIVFDLSTDRVAYCVLRTGGALSLSQKLHAVPLRAFQASPDDSYLTLQVDRAKFEQAAGFDPKEWPAAVNPAWGAEPFWQEHTPAPSPTPASAPGEPEESPEAPSAPQPEPK